MNSKEMLAQARKYYSSFGEGPWRDSHAPMLALVDWIERADLASELYVSAGLSGLWISDRPHDPNGDHMLQVQVRGSDYVYFEYAVKRGALEKMNKTVRYQDSVECFRQFIAYKFGLHRKS